MEDEDVVMSTAGSEEKKEVSKSKLRIPKPI
jgi:hypothetical protein